MSGRASGAGVSGGCFKHVGDLRARRRPEKVSVARRADQRLWAVPGLRASEYGGGDTLRMLEKLRRGSVTLTSRTVDEEVLPFALAKARMEFSERAQKRIHLPRAGGDG